jgi:hypothetical protein
MILSNRDKNTTRILEVGGKDSYFIGRNAIE